MVIYALVLEDASRIPCHFEFCVRIMLRHSMISEVKHRCTILLRSFKAFYQNFWYWTHLRKILLCWIRRYIYASKLVRLWVLFLINRWFYEKKTYPWYFLTGRTIGNQCFSYDSYFKKWLWSSRRDTQFFKLLESQLESYPLKNYIILYWWIVTQLKNHIRDINSSHVILRHKSIILK